jgi:hypothetical protein
MGLGAGQRIRVVRGSVRFGYRAGDTGRLVLPLRTRTWLVKMDGRFGGTTVLTADIELIGESR